MTTKKNVQGVFFIRPDDRAVMMVAATFLSQSNRLGEASVLRIVGDQHGSRTTLAVLGGFGIAVVDDVEPIIQVDRLRTLSGVVKHLELPGFAEGEKLALRDQVSAT